MGCLSEPDICFRQLLGNSSVILSNAVQRMQICNASHHARPRRRRLLLAILEGEICSSQVAGRTLLASSWTFVE